MFKLMMMTYTWEKNSNASKQKINIEKVIKVYQNLKVPLFFSVWCYDVSSNLSSVDKILLWKHVMCSKFLLTNCVKPYFTFSFHLRPRLKLSIRIIFLKSVNLDFVWTSETYYFVKFYQNKFFIVIH